MTSDPTNALPHSAETERAALSCLFRRPCLIPHASTILEVGDFHIPAHRLLFDLLVEFDRDSKPIDELTIQQALIERRLLNKVGGAATVLEIQDAVVSPEQFGYHAAILLEKSSLRRLWLTGEWMQRAASDFTVLGDLSIDQLISDAAARVEASRRTSSREHEVCLRTAIDALVGQIEQVMEDREQGRPATLIPTITTGLPWVDILRKGYERGSLVLLAALSHAGKTALARFAMLGQVAGGLRCLHFSLESTVQREAAQALATLAPIKLGSLKDGCFVGNDAQRIARAGGAPGLGDYYIDESTGLTIEEIVARACAHHAKYGLDVVCIDHGLIVDPSERRVPREQQCAHISGMAKQLAKRINGVVMLLWQFNKSGQARGFGGRCPGKADLMWTSAVYQDADYALFMHRPEVGEDDSFRPSCELYLPKWRNGGTLEEPITLLFDGETQSFTQT